MKFVDVGQHAYGVIAIGQEAVGIFAFGQVATGVIAIGQMARGGFCVGQLAFGFIGWGQAGFGIFHAAGMVGVGGRRGLGIVLPLVPSVGRRRVPPQVTTIEAVHAGAPGWIEADLAQDQLGLGLYRGGQRLPIKLDRRLQSGAREVAREHAAPVWAFTRRVGPTLVCERIAHDPPRPYQKKGFWALSTIQLLALLGLGGAWWAAAGNDLVAGIEKIVAEDAAPAKPPATSPAVPKRR